jgi:hypothetical protein
MRMGNSTAPILSPEDELATMENSYREQCSYGDMFWGVDLEMSRMLYNLDTMTREDGLSREHERYHNTLELRREWENEHNATLQQQAYQDAVIEQQRRQKYLAAFFANASSVPVMENNWTHGKGNNNEAARKQEVDVLSAGNKKANKNEDESLRIPTFGRTKTLFHANGLQQARTLTEDKSMVFEDPLEDSYASINTTITNALDYGKVQLQEARKMKKLAEEIMHGHPLYQWDQETLLRESFTALDSTNSGTLTPASVCKVAKNERVKAFLRYTVFGRYVKRKQWRALLEVLFTSESSPENSDVISLGHFYDIALRLSYETSKPLLKIKTHEEYFEELSSPSENVIFFAEQARLNNFTAERDLALYRDLKVGDVVWSLYSDGSQWLPAVIVSCNADYTYDLKYPMSQDELRSARKQAHGNKILGREMSASGTTENSAEAMSDLLKMNVLRSQHPQAANVAQKAIDTGDPLIMKAVSSILEYNKSNYV